MPVVVPWFGAWCLKKGKLCCWQRLFHSQFHSRAHIFILSPLCSPYYSSRICDTHFQRKTTVSLHSFLKLPLWAFSGKKRWADRAGPWPAPYTSLAATAENHTKNLQMGKLLEGLSRGSMAAWAALLSHTGYVQCTTNALHMMAMKRKCCAFHILCFSNNTALGKL